MWGYSPLLCVDFAPFVGFCSKNHPLFLGFGKLKMPSRFVRAWVYVSYSSVGWVALAPYLVAPQVRLRCVGWRGVAFHYPLLKRGLIRLKSLAVRRVSRRTAAPNKKPPTSTVDGSLPFLFLKLYQLPSDISNPLGYAAVIGIA